MSAATRVAPPRRRVDRSRMVRACSDSRRARRRLRSCGQGRPAEQRRGRVRIAARRKAPQIVRRDRQGLLAAARPFEVRHLAAERFGHVPAAGRFFEVPLVPAERARRALGRLRPLAAREGTRPRPPVAIPEIAVAGPRARVVRASSLPMKRAASASAARSSPSADSSTRASPRRWASATTSGRTSSCEVRLPLPRWRRWQPVAGRHHRLSIARALGGSAIGALGPRGSSTGPPAAVDGAGDGSSGVVAALPSPRRSPLSPSPTESVSPARTGHSPSDMGPVDRDDAALHLQIEALTRRVPGQRKRGAVDPHLERPRLEQPARVLAVAGRRRALALGTE